MYWLSESADALASHAAGIDVLVVGSGYGAAIAALRFSEAGREVFLLERGKEYLAGEFPSDLSQAGNHVRAETAGADGVKASGGDDALFDFRLGLNAGALVGNGLGGGSLINAAVGLRPDDAVFRQREWPAALRQEDLGPWFARATATLGVRVPGRGQSFDLRRTPKYLRLRELAREAAALAEGGVEVTFEDAPLAIQMEGVPSLANGPRANCVGCGDCVTGCNHDAKLSVDKTCLPAAKRAGARLFTGVTVLSVLHEPGTDPAHPWKVTVVRTAERALRQALVESGDPAADGWTQELRAAHVVLAAGTFGSTEILLRSRAQGLPVSPTALGMRVSGNGDDVSFAWDLARPARAVGAGARPVGDTPAGPTISGIVRFRDAENLARSTITEDGSAPGLMRGLWHEMLATLGTVAQLDRWSFRSHGADPLALDDGALGRSLVLLGMGHDRAGGAIVYDGRHDRIGWGWPDAATEPGPALHARRMEAVEAMGGIPIGNPAVGVLPKSVSQMLSGPAPGGSLFTVHPLGGCRMGDSPLDGVVNHWGQVFRPDGSLHPGLYVMDGSVVPTSLGANPMLTIAALAERACAKILQGMAPGAPKAVPLPPRPVVARWTSPTPAPSTSTTMKEALRGSLAVAPGAALQGLAPVRGRIDAALFMQFQVGGWRELFAHPAHRAFVPAAADPDDYAAPRLVLADAHGHELVLKVERGHVDVFRPVRESIVARGSRMLRLAFTYAAGRWIPDGIKQRRRGRPGIPKGQLVPWIASAAKSLVHASEIREFAYDLELAAPDGQWYRLRGTKRVEADASWAALRAWLGERLRGRWPAPARRSVWDQVFEADMTLSTRAGDVLATGRLRMDLVDVLRQLPSQLGPRGDTLNAMLDFAGYPLLVLRALLKTRLLDFRAPDYADGLPDTDPALLARPPGEFELDDPRNAFPPLPTRRHGDVAPERPVRLDVRRGHRAPPHETVRIGLVRYRQPRLAWQDDATGLAKARAIVLLNGFAQSTRAFVAPELGRDALAARLHDDGWDVWLLEYRVSPLLDASALESTMDDIAAFDVPAAVAHVAATVSAESGRDPARTQVFAFSHCVGSAALAMSVLGGWLRLPGATSADGIEANRLAGLLFSQFHPFVVGSETAQQRLQLGAFLRNALGRQMVNFAAGSVQADLLHALLDRVFATFHTEAGEHCPHDHDLREEQPDATTCRRMTGLLSRLFAHRQLHPATHAHLDWYFGRTNLGVFLHGAKCVEYERLVNAEGHNAYVTDANVERRLAMPVMLLHGKENVLFDKESMRRSRDELRRIFGASQDKTEWLLVPGHAHFDCTIGIEAPRVIFPRVLAFFDRAFAGGVSLAHPPAAWSMRLPRTGPVVGAVTQGADATAVNVWVELDTASGDEAQGAVSRLSYRAADGTRVERFGHWPASVTRLDAGDAIDPRAVRPVPDGRGMDVRHAIARLEIPAGATEVEARVLGLHVDAPPGVAPPPPDPAPAWAAWEAALRDELAVNEAVARRAAPKTLSRTRREIRDWASCEVRLGAAQLGDALPGEPFTFLAAACRYPGITAMEADRADAALLEASRSGDAAQGGFMAMLGDQIYADARAGLFDTASPIESLLPRYRQAFGSPGFRALASRLPLVMTADDHEIANGWTADALRGGPAALALAANARALFGVFQRAHGPADPATGMRGHAFSFARGGAAFFVLDTRFDRRFHPRPRMILPADHRRLREWLLAEQAAGDHPKFILSGSVFAPGLRWGEAAGRPARGTDTWQDFPGERRRLLGFIARHAVRGVVFLSSDYHCSAVARIDLDGRPLAHAIVAPPLHAPLRFANTSPGELADGERIPLAGGRDAVVRVMGAWEGEGWLRLDVERPEIPRGAWRVGLTWRLRDRDTGRATQPEGVQYDLFGSESTRVPVELSEGAAEGAG